MDTNREEPGDDGKLLFRAEIFQIVGCAIEVLNTLGHGLIEKPYENALVEFGLRNIPLRQQPAFDVLYKGQKVGLFIPDLIAFDANRRGYESDRPDYRPRTWTDAELSADNQAPCWRHPQFQALQTRAAANRSVTLVSIRVYSWLIS